MKPRYRYFKSDVGDACNLHTAKKIDGLEQAANTKYIRGKGNELALPEGCPGEREVLLFFSTG